MARSRRGEVLAVAASLFDDKGYRSTSIEDITQALGFTKAALYYYVHSKQELLDELARQVGRQLLDATDLAHLDPGTRVERLRAFGHTYVPTVVSMRAAFAVTIRERYELSTDALAELEAREDEHVRRVSSLVAPLRSTRRLRPPPSVASHALLSMFGSVADWYRPRKGALSPERVADAIVDLFLSGVAATKKPTPTIDKRPTSIPPAVPAGVASERRAEILAAGARLFHSKGYEATTMQDIADLLGVTKAALYYYVSGKQEVLQEIMRGIGYELYDAAQSIAEGQPPDRALVGLMHQHLAWLHQERTLFSILLLSRSALDDAAFEEFRKGGQVYAELYGRLLRAGAAAGTLREVEIAIVRPALLGCLNATLRWFDRIDAFTPEDLSAMVVDIVMRGYAPPRR